MNKTDKVKRIASTVVFNVAETMLIFLVGKSLDLPIESIIVIMMTFTMSRGVCGKALHFKTWYRCLIWSLLILFSLFVFLKFDFFYAMVFAIFSAFIMTGKADMKDMYLWSGKSSKYCALKDFVAISPNNGILLEHEEYWRKNYPIRYEIFKMYFRENKTYKEIAEIKDLDDNTIIKKECATIYSILERPLNLPPINKDS